MNVKRLAAKLGVLLLLLCTQLLSSAQEKKISGKITDKKTGLPLEGASVKVKNTKESTLSDANGTFTIKAPSSESVIAISHVGYSFYESKAGEGDLNIQLDNIAADLDEVIVVGYGTQKKSHLTGAVESIKAKEIEDLPISNLGAALSGRILGLGVSGGTSRPGSQAQLTIRNPVSLAKDGGNNNPLFIIDGVIQITSQGLNDATLFNSLDPSEVESISVLKDGAAAIYGSRGANGAIVVQTKRGKAGKPRISYSGSYAINDEAYRTKMMSAADLAKYINIVNGPNGANVTNASDRTRFFSQDELDHFAAINHDWLDMAWKSAYNTRHTINIGGGAEKATYFANVSYYTQDGNLGKLEYGKWTYRAGADVTVANGLKAGLQVGGNYQSSMEMNSKIGGENIENDYRNLLRAPRYVPPYINGKPVRLPGASGSSNLSAYHFFELNNLDNYMDKDDNLSTVNLYLEYEAPFLKGLKARVSYARNTGSGHDARVGSRYMLYRFNQLGDNQHIYEGATVRDSAFYNNDNSVRFFNKTSKLQQANFTLSYSKSFGQHNVSALFSAERSEAESTQEDVSKESPSIFTNGQFNTAFGAIDGRTFAYESGNLGYVGRLNYSYASKYLAEFLFRTDASNKFAPENYWGKFYSASAGWVISSEDFFKSSAVDYLKLRYSIGLLGKDDTRAWQWRQRFTFQNGKGGQFGADNNPADIGMKMEVSPNADVTWSDELKQNIGIDARFFKNRLSSTVELFYNKGTNMLIERTGVVPITVGGSIASQNWGAIDFFGYELGLGWEDNIGKDFTYGVSTRFSWADNKVKKGNFNDIDALYPWNDRPDQSSDNGKWGYDYLGMFYSQADIDGYVSKYNITSVFGTSVDNLRPGMLYYRDVRGSIKADGTFAGPDGVIDDNDQVKLSKKASNHYGFGMTLKAGFKGLNFECVIAGSFGGWSEIDGRNLLERNIDNLYQNGVSYWGNIYDPTLNPYGKYPNPYHGDISLTPVSDFWKVNGLRLRMRNANLNYSIPKSITDRLKINSARIVLSALNPLNFYNPFDYKDSDGAWDTYPVLRTYSVGVNVTL
ncbi:SusC/RagA family TonB-linked outer membrane protein [Terrimonas pollutisoli]|uniref:SusC/RagA family TonB-linked outer membrane protein n=1 Tax=Terrimonas pollutisoli TaxID=3034147 RepID=UPI0023EDE7F1|nr:SusC/RagA family TonB-linked outer membrane protein [Terrimonas sp. H1YJ31]